MSGDGGLHQINHQSHFMVLHARISWELIMTVNNGINLGHEIKCKRFLERWYWPRLATGLRVKGLHLLPLAICVDGKSEREPTQEQDWYITSPSMWESRLRHMSLESLQGVDTVYLVFTYGGIVWWLARSATVGKHHLMLLAIHTNCIISKYYKQS